MRRVIYTSKSLIEGNPSQLDAILTVSAERNREAGITGMLWSDGAHFAQVLEGEPQAVEATMNRICADPRHSHIDVVLDRIVMCRQFGHWAMTRADDSFEGVSGTSFLIGFAVGERSGAARHLYEVLMAAEGHDA